MAAGTTRSDQASQPAPARRRSTSSVERHPVRFVLCQRSSGCLLTSAPAASRARGRCARDTDEGLIRSRQPSRSRRRRIPLFSRQLEAGGATTLEFGHDAPLRSRTVAGSTPPGSPGRDGTGRVPASNAAPSRRVRSVMPRPSGRRWPAATPPPPGGRRCRGGAHARGSFRSGVQENHIPPSTTID